MGADPFRDMPDPSSAEDGLDSAEYVVSIDLFLNDSNRDADVMLPAAGFAEKEGTVTNLEGRVQKVNAIRPGPGTRAVPTGRSSPISPSTGRLARVSSPETIAKEISEVAPVYQGVTWDLLEWEERDGAVVPIEGTQPIHHMPVALGA